MNRRSFLVMIGLAPFAGIASENTRSQRAPFQFVGDVLLVRELRFDWNSVSSATISNFVATPV